jgi:hypothetical protein
MAWPIETISIHTMQSPPGPVPHGLKIVTFSDRDTQARGAPTPVICVGSFCIWPMSYGDNRMSFGLVVYDPCCNTARVVEKRGARYVYKITRERDGGVTVWGQSDHNVTLSPDDIGAMLVHPQ